MFAHITVFPLGKSRKHWGISLVIRENDMDHSTIYFKWLKMSKSKKTKNGNGYIYSTCTDQKGRWKGVDIGRLKTTLKCDCWLFPNMEKSREVSFLKLSGNPVSFLKHHVCYMLFLWHDICAMVISVLLTYLLTCIVLCTNSVEFRERLYWSVKLCGWWLFISQATSMLSNPQMQQM